MKRTSIVAVLLSGLLSGAAVPALAAVPDIDPPWLTEVDELDGALTQDVLERRARWAEWRAMLAVLHDTNGPYDVTPRPRSRTVVAAAPAPAVYSQAVERWRPLVEAYFLPGDVPWAMRVLRCESQGDAAAKNPRSTASGLFQHLARLWPERAARAGWPAADVFDPTANVAVAAWLYYTDGRGHWVCR